jgi:4-hydroxybenzoate polyprenyltransferase
MRLDKPVGIYLLLWPTYWALFLAADGWPDDDLLVIFTIGVIVMRSAGCVINDYADREIDKHVERTQNRPIASGEVSPKNALLLFFVLVLVAFGLVLLTNALTVQLSFVAVALAAFYPFTKRFIQLPQFVLGLAFGMSVLMAFSAQTGGVPVEAYWLFAASIVWTLIYDTIYAMADREEDLEIGVKSTAILFAKYDRIIIGILQVVLFVTFLKIGSLFDLGLFYQLSALIISILMMYHQFLIKNRQKTACFKAFLHNHYIGMTLFAGILASLFL